MKRDIHTYFGLSYANYLVLPRSVMQSMPEEWQYQFVELLEQLDDTNWRSDLMPDEWHDYLVKARNYKNKFIYDPLCDYQRGRRNVFKE